MRASQQVEPVRAHARACRRPTELQEQSPSINGALAVALAALPELPFFSLLLTGGAAVPLDPAQKASLGRVGGAFGGVRGVAVASP
eukprot:15275706-Alexandrium_andersonii.AAC.1